MYHWLVDNLVSMIASRAAKQLRAASSADDDAAEERCDSHAPEYSFRHTAL
jgi:hypothetical protein